MLYEVITGIKWLEDAPQADDDSVALIDADVAARLRVVPLRTEGAGGESGCSVVWVLVRI